MCVVSCSVPVNFGFWIIVLAIVNNQYLIKMHRGMFWDWFSNRISASKGREGQKVELDQNAEQKPIEYSKLY